MSLMPGPLQRAFHAHHVNHGNAFRDGDNQFNAGIRRFENRIRSERRGHEDAGDVGRSLAHGFADGIEHGDFVRIEFHDFAAAARGDAADEVRPVFEALLRMKFSGGAGDALNDQARIGVDQNAHGRTGACFSWTTAINPAMRKPEFFHWNVSTEVSCSASSYSCKNPSTSFSGISTTSGRSTFS